jgi:competence protein ComEC
MKRPLLPILASVIGGILIEQRWQLIEHLTLPGLPLPPYLFALLVAALFGVVWYLGYRRAHLRFASLILLLLTMVVGMMRYAATTHLPTHHIARLVHDEVVTIEGFLYRPPERVTGRYGRRRYLYVRATALEQGAWRYRVCGNLRLTLTTAASPRATTKTFAYGDQLRMRLRLHQPENFGTFDYRAYLRRRGITLVGTLKHDRYILKRPDRHGNPCLRGLYALRSRMIRFLDQHAPTADDQTVEALQVIKAMTLGTKRELRPVLKDRFRLTGMYHLLVISGIHIGLLAWMFNGVLYHLHVPLRYRSLGFTPVFVVYAGLTGFQFPVLRAVIMAVVLYFAITCSRVSDPLYSLAFAVFLILWLSPGAVFEISLQLTVGATASILIVLKFLQHFKVTQRVQRLPFMLRIPLMTLIMSAGAMLGIAPLLLFHFQRFYPFSLISNVAALPIVSLLLPASLATQVLALIAPGPLIAPLLTANVILAKALIRLTSWFPPLRTTLPAPSVFALLLYYLTVLGGFYLSAGEIKSSEIKRLFFKKI